jgi:tetratricopeptide (TPR) repeat protein
MIKALEVLSSTYGDEHRQVAQSYMELGDLFENESYESNKPELRKKTSEYYNKSILLCEKIYSDVSERARAKSKNNEQDNLHSSKKVCQIDAKQAALDLSAVLRHTADFYATDDEFKQAEPMYQRALNLEQQILGPNDKDVYVHKANLAQFYCDESKSELALPLFKEALQASQKDDPESHQTVLIHNRLGNYYREQKKFEEAENSFRQAFDILTKCPEKDEMEIAENGAALSDVLDKEGKPEQAKEICESTINRLTKSNDKQALLLVLKQYQKHFLQQHQKEEAEKISTEIKSIQLKEAAGSSSD